MNRSRTTPLLFFAILAVVSPILAQSPPTPAEQALLKGVRTVRVTVSESGDRDKTSPLPFVPVCRVFLRYAGVDVVEREPCDAVLAITARGRAIAGSYGGGHRAYSGAALDGTLTLSIQGRAVRSRSYAGKEEPPPTIWEGSYRTPDSAPFRTPFYAAFLPSLAGLVGDLGGVPALIAALKDPTHHRIPGSSSIRVRDDAAIALGKLGRPAGEAVAAILEEPDADLRRAAAEALRKMGWRPANPSQDAAYAVAAREWDKAGQLGAVAVRPLIIALADGDFVDRDGPARALAQIGAPAFEPLLGALRSDAPRTRRLAARALGLMGDTRASEALLALLKDANPFVRGSAAAALGDLRVSAAVDPILAMQKEPNLEVRAAYVTALGKLKDPRAFPAVLAAAQSTNESLRTVGFSSLVELGDGRAVAPLAAMLRDNRSSSRAAVARTLGALKDPRGVAPLAEALRSPHAALREVAAAALGELGDPSGIAPLTAALKDKSPAVRAVAAKALEKLKAAR